MKYLFLLPAIAIFSACSGNNKEEKAESAPAEAMTAKTVQVSPATTSSITNLLASYYQLKDALVEYDTAAANKAAASLVTAADSVNTKEITDSALALTLQNFSGSIASEAKALAGET